MVATVDMADTEHPVRVESVQGTGFLLANGRGLGITARHVATHLRAATSVPDGRLAVAAFVDGDGGLRSSPIGKFDMHPSEDVALFRLQPDDFFAPFTVTADQHYGSAHYQLWGYPDDVRYDRLSTRAERYTCHACIRQVIFGGASPTN
jgi:hypothetical protein